MNDDVDLIAVGQIVKPFGVRGEVRVRSLSDVPGRFERLRRVTVEAPSGRVLVTAVTRVREDRGVAAGYVLGLEALTTPEQAAAWRGALLKIPRDQAPPLPEGAYYEFQLVGLTVSDEAGEELGTLTDIWETGAHHVFVIRGDGWEVLLPATKQAVASVDLEQGTMVVRRAALVSEEAPSRTVGA
jgi:16S rRNA processing protein RimM